MYYTRMNILFCHVKLQNEFVSIPHGCVPSTEANLRLHAIISRLNE